LEQRPGPALIRQAQELRIERARARLERRELPHPGGSALLELEDPSAAARLLLKQPRAQLEQGRRARVVEREGLPDAGDQLAQGPPPSQPGLEQGPALAERPRLARVLLRLRRELSSSRLGAPPLVLERLQPLFEARHRELCGRI